MQILLQNSSFWGGRERERERNGAYPENKGVTSHWIIIVSISVQRKATLFPSLCLHLFCFVPLHSEKCWRNHAHGSHLEAHSSNQNSHMLCWKENTKTNQKKQFYNFNFILSLSRSKMDRGERQIGICQKFL